MDIASLLFGQDTPAIVVWFALMVVVFAVFVGLGIYEGRRTEARERLAEQARPDPRGALSASGRIPQQHDSHGSHRTNTHRKEYT